MPHIRRQQVAGQVSKRTSRLTWIGFQKMPDKTRIFLQTYKVPAFRVERGKREGEIVVVLQNTMIGAYNFRRLMDARWIPRSIYGIRSWRRGKDTYVSIQTRSQVEFSLSVQGNYLMLDFDDKAIEQYFFDKQKTVYDDPNTQNELRGAD